MRLLALTKFLEEFGKLQNPSDEFNHVGQILEEHPKVVVVHINSNWRTQKSPHEWRAIKKPLFRAACICWAQLPQQLEFYQFRSTLCSSPLIHESTGFQWVIRSLYAAVRFRGDVIVLPGL